MAGADCILPPPPPLRVARLCQNIWDGSAVRIAWRSKKNPCALELIRGQRARLRVLAGLTVERSAAAWVKEELAKGSLGVAGEE